MAVRNTRGKYGTVTDCTDAQADLDMYSTCTVRMCHQTTCIDRIRPNYRTVRLGFSNLQDTLICGQICIYLLRIHYKKRSVKDLFNDDYAIFSGFLYKGICCGYSFELHRLVDAIQMSPHNICLCKEVKKKVH